MIVITDKETGEITLRSLEDVHKLNRLNSEKKVCRNSPPIKEKCITLCQKPGGVPLQL